jgi:CubicO group peptidase (beta-lactamase class C family)
MKTRLAALALLFGTHGCGSRAEPPAVASRVDSIGPARDLLFLKPAQQAPTYRHMNQVFPARVFKHGATVFRLPKASVPMADVQYELGGRSYGLDSFIVRTHVAGLLVIQDGKIVLERYAQGNDENARWMSFSVGKSMVSTLTGAAIRDGVIKSIDDPITTYLPDLKGSTYESVTVRHLLQMSSGVKYNENYLDRTADINTVVECMAKREAGCIQRAVRSLPRAGLPGTIFNYNTAETHLLGLVVSAATGRFLADYLAEKIWGPFGMEQDGYWLLEAENGKEFSGGGLNMTLRDWGRFGQFILGGGEAAGRPVLPNGWLEEATRPLTPQVQYGKLYPGFPLGYGYLWWLYPVGQVSVPNTAGAFEAEGVFGQAIHIDRAKKLVVVIWSTWPKPDWGDGSREQIAFLSALSGALK